MRRIFFRSFAIFCTLGVAQCLWGQGAPKKGGAIIFGRGGDSTSLDPAVVTDGESLNVTDNIFENLVTMKVGTTDIIPAIAERWDISSDGLRYEFHIRPHLKFHDGTPVDAEAVKFSFMRQHDPSHPAYNFGGPYVYYTSMGMDKIIKAIETPSSDRVVFLLSRAEAPFLASLALQSFAIVSPNGVMKYKSEFGRNPVGSGPFIFVRWEKNQKIIIKSNPDYWDGAPYVEKVIFRAIPDNSTRLMEVLAGNIQIMDNPNPQDVPVIKAKLGDKVELMAKPGFNVAYLAMNMDKKPFDNPKVRQAIAMAINKQGIISTVYKDQAALATTLLPPDLWGFNPSIKDIGYDLAKAKALLTEAGYKDGFKTTLWAMPVPRPYMPDGRKIAEIVQGDLGRIGIAAEIVSYEWGTYLDKAQQGEHDMGLFGWTGDIGDPDNFLYVLLDKDSAVKPAQNFAFYRSDELHTILMKAKQISTIDERVTLYKRAQEIISRDLPVVPLVHSVTTIPVRTQVAGFVPDPTGRRRFAKVWIR